MLIPPVCKINKRYYISYNRGAKLAAPEKTCVCVTGDGGFLMVCQEILTAVEWNLPIIWFVFNDTALKSYP